VAKTFSNPLPPAGSLSRQDGRYALGVLECSYGNFDHPPVVLAQTQMEPVTKEDSHLRAVSKRNAIHAASRQAKAKAPNNATLNARNIAEQSTVIAVIEISSGTM
jgi:hypothetical protein